MQLDLRAFTSAHRCDSAWLPDRRSAPLAKGYSMVSAVYLEVAGAEVIFPWPNHPQGTINGRMGRESEPRRHSLPKR